MKLLIVIATAISLIGCSASASNDVETAPYTLIASDDKQQIEVRSYEPMVLVSADMNAVGRNNAFRLLFRYISGENEGAREVSMTAPVFMEGNEPSRNGAEIPMTAPVFMDSTENQSMMSFVMPKEFTLQTTPMPLNPSLQVRELKNYKVAAIQFSGTLSERNVAKHSKILVDWITENGYTVINQPVEAGYNGPLTLPMFRRNEVLIEIE